MASGSPDQSVLERTNLFYTDACLCGVSALALRTNAPTILRAEALEYAVPVGHTGKPLGTATTHGATCFGSSQRVKAEKAILANANAVREWDSNGTNFGYNPALGHTAGEFGHNDFYAVPVAAAQMLGAGGDVALKGMFAIVRPGHHTTPALCRHSRSCRRARWTRCRTASSRSSTTSAACA